MPVYSIGHGRVEKEKFLENLQKFDIQFLIDVRSLPYSKWSPDYNRETLKKFLKDNGIIYVFMGDTLGGRPSDDSCYTVEGKADYEIMKNKEFFQKGLERIKKANEKNINVALMCSEGKPTECHRSKLIGKNLIEEGIIVQHIEENGNLKDQKTVWNEINKGIPSVDLFGNIINTSNKIIKKS